MQIRLFLIQLKLFYFILQLIIFSTNASMIHSKHDINKVIISNILLIELVINCAISNHVSICILAAEWQICQKKNEMKYFFS